MEIAKKVKKAFQRIKGIIYSRTNSKDIHTKSTNSGRDRYIRFYIRHMFSLKISRWIVFSSILQLQNDTARTEL